MKIKGGQTTGTTIDWGEGTYAACRFGSGHTSLVIPYT
jgi:hypothetical protein